MFVKLGCTSLRPTVYRWLPSLVLTNYSPAPVVEQSGEHLRLVDHLWNLVTNWADAYNTAWDTNTDGALGHKAGTDKKEATDCYRNRVLKGQYIWHLTR